MADASLYGNGEKCPACELRREAPGRNLRGFQSGEPLNDWLREPEKATGWQAFTLTVGGFLILAAVVGGGGWLIAEAIKAAGWDG